MATPWHFAATALVRWLQNAERADALLDEAPAAWGRADRARCQHLFYGVLRHLGRLDRAVSARVARPPRPEVRAVLLLASFELSEAGGDAGKVARIVHHAVERAKELATRPEAGLVNAVVRRLVADLAASPAPGPSASVTELATAYSHPEWLVARWSSVFGPEAAAAFLAWNQTPAPVHARWRRPESPPPDFLAPTPWPGFFQVAGGHWEEVEKRVGDGSLFIQDPATRLAVDALAPRPGESLLDACAAPGGKSLAIADALGTGRLVSLDLPGSRVARLKENLSRAPAGVDVALVQADLTRDAASVLAEHGLPRTFSGVLLDAPCSNSGVMRHRVDVKWRLREGDFEKHGAQQERLLRAAASLVAPGGRLVYSTCSVDPEENERVVARFLDRARGWTLGGQRLAHPWVEGHDGAAVFTLLAPG